MLHDPPPSPRDGAVLPLTFRHFVTGPQNALAYNAALSVARTPGTLYNPLYLTGGVGLGKTHMLSAIAAYLRPRLGGAEPILTTGDAFVQEYLHHLRRGHLLLFRRRYRRAGALLLDGLEALAGHDVAAEELVVTLDALREANRQIVLADAQRPCTLYGLPERLHRRLSASLIAALGVPDEATRLAILRHKVGSLGGAPCGDEAMAVLAARVRGSVRDLETGLARLAREAATRGPVTATLATQVAGEVNRATRAPRGQARGEEVLQAVCAYYGLPRAVLIGKSRATPVAQARQVAMYLLREDAGLTATRAGLALARDHSTVLHGHGKIAAAVSGGDPLTAAVLDGIRKSVLQGRVDRRSTGAQL